MSARKKSHGTASFPRQIGLQLARLAAAAPSGRDWLHETKFDGYRVLIWRDGKTVRITSRGDQDWSARLENAVRATTQLPCRSCVLDGELVALDASGNSSFGLLQQLFGGGDRQLQLRVMLFDLLYIDGTDLRSAPQLERKQQLARLLRQASTPLSCTPHSVGDGPAAAKAACAAGREGIICKLSAAPYREGRSGAWLKVKCVQSDEYAIVGYTTGQGAREALGSLLLGTPATAGTWRYCGRVGTGLTEATIAQLLRQLQPARAPLELENSPSRVQLRGASPVWTEPRLVVEVEFRGITEDGLLRQASLKGLRQDRAVTSLRRRQRDTAEMRNPVGRVKKT
jgi:bifunctional non-homologous end joining protein LigD